MDELAERQLSNEMAYLRALSEATGGACDPEGAILKASLTGAYAFFNEAVIKDGSRPPAAEEIGSMERFYSRNGVPFNIHAHRGHDHEAFAGKMASYGYRLHSSYNGMAVEIRSMKPSQCPKGVALRYISSKDQMPLFCGAAVRGNEMPLDMGDELVRILSTIDPQKAREMALMVAERDGAPVGTSILMRGDDTAGVYFVSTVPEERGKGIAGWMTYETLKLAASEGYDIGVLGATPLGYPVYRRVGFYDVATIDEYIKA